MTSQVLHMTHSVDRDLVTRLFAKFSARYGKLWSSRLGDDGDWSACADDWFYELSRFTLEQVRAAVNKALAIYREFPPTQGQLIDLCLKESGTPQVADVIRLMVARDFNHPLVKMVYDKIGGWALTNGKESDIQAKAKEAYAECLAEFILKPEASWGQLEAYNQKPKELPPPPKLPTNEESKGFKERMAEFQQKLEDAKLAVKGVPYREFDEKKIKVGGKDFDKEVYNEYKAYLLSIPEDQTMILPPIYIFQRMRFIGQQEQKAYLDKVGYVPQHQRAPTEEPRRGSGRPERVYKSWAND